MPVGSLSQLYTPFNLQRLRSENAGSFIRPTTHLVYGVSFLTALTSKYVEALHGSDTQETVVLGSSQGTIEVEAVSLDKVRQKFARLDQLREISLEHANVVKGDEPGRILQSCPSMFSISYHPNLYLFSIYFDRRSRFGPFFKSFLYMGSYCRNH